MSGIESLHLWRDVMTDAVRGDAPDLSMRQWAILLTVYLQPGPHTVRGLARDLNVPKPAISRALDALSILGFVSRARDPEDRRVVHVRRTADGAVFVERFAGAIDRCAAGPALQVRYG